MEVIKFHELWVFIACLLSGAVSGFVFDIFRAIRREKNVSDKTVAIHDMLFWLISCLIVYMALYISNGAELRWFELVGLCVGVVFYMLCLSCVCIKFLRGTIRVLIRTARVVAKPFVAVGSFVFRLFSGLASKLSDALCAIRGRAGYFVHSAFSKIRTKKRDRNKNVFKKFVFTFLKR